MKSASRYGTVASCVMLVTGAARVLGEATTEKKEFSASLRAADLLSLGGQECAAVQGKDRLDLFRKVLFGGEDRGAEIVAFEERRLFTFAAGVLPPTLAASQDAQKPTTAPRWIRRLLLLKPATIIVEDDVRPPAPEGEVARVLRSTGKPQFSGKGGRIVEGERELVFKDFAPLNRRLVFSSKSAADQTPYRELRVIAKTADSEVRFSHAFRVVARGEKPPDDRCVVGTSGPGPRWLEASGIGRDRRITLILDSWHEGPRFLTVTSRDGTGVPSRPLPSGILPHTPEGLRMLERWDGTYRGRAPSEGSSRPGWDIGRPSSHLIEAGNANETRQYGPPRVKEEEMRADFSTDFEFVELREAHFDTTDPNAEGALSWVILLRRKDKP